LINAIDKSYVELAPDGHRKFFAGGVFIKGVYKGYLKSA
jgi:hypothetical protein